MAYDKRYHSSITFFFNYSALFFLDFRFQPQHFDRSFLLYSKNIEIANDGGSEIATIIDPRV